MDERKTMKIVEIDYEHPGYVGKAVALHNKNYQDVRTEAEWAWEFKGKQPERSVFVVTESEDEVVGTQGMIPIDLVIDGRRILTGKSEGSLLDRAYRGGDLFKEMYYYAISLCRAKGMSCVWGLTTASKVWRDKLGFQVYEGAVQSYFVPLRLLCSGSSIDDGGGRRRSFLVALFGVAYLYGLARRHLLSPIRGPRGGETSLSDVQVGQDDVRRLYSRVMADRPDCIYIDQSEEYRTWRFGKNPLTRYSSVYLYSDSRLVGYCCFSIIRKIARLTDLVFENDDHGAMLIESVFRKARSAGAEIALYMTNPKNALGSKILSLLRKQGFISSRNKGPSFILKEMGTGEGTYDITRWFLGGIWTEGTSW